METRQPREFHVSNPWIVFLLATKTKLSPFPTHPTRDPSWKHEPDAPQSCPPPVSRYDGIFRLGGAIEENVTKGSRTKRLKGEWSLVCRLILPGGASYAGLGYYVCIFLASSF